MTTSTTLKRTPLYEEHLALNAKMVPFGGWEMPVQYEGILSEHQHTREAVTIFDISHMGEFIVEGDAKESGLDYLVTQNIIDLPVGSARYGCLLNEKGGVMDDLIVFRLAEKKWFIVVNASTTDKDAQCFRAFLNKSAKFQDISLQTGKIDIQGPQSRDVLKKFIPDIDRLTFYAFDYFELLGERVLISRTGYTGELGYEIFYPWDKTKGLWQKLLTDNRVKPAGLGARDVLRLEVGYSLYGHELNETISPLESGLDKFVDLGKDFRGKEALLKQKQEGLKRKLIGFISDNRRSPREGFQIYSAQDEEIGTVTSGTFSPILNKGIGLGFVPTASAKLNEKIYFGNDKNKNSAMIAGKIFYKNGSLKN